MLGECQGDSTSGTGSIGNIGRSVGCGISVNVKATETATARDVKNSSKRLVDVGRTSGD